MLSRILRRNRRDDASAYALYGAIVAQARQPDFYLRYAVPDTPEGRFDLIVLHAVLLIHRLRGEGGAGHELGQQVFDIFFRDMDRGLREMGVGDLGVPKRIKAMARGFYGRTAAYLEALGASDPPRLGEAIGRNLFTGEGNPKSAAALGRYGIAAAAGLAAQPYDAIAAGHLTFPAPARYMKAR